MTKMKRLATLAAALLAAVSAAPVLAAPPGVNYQGLLRYYNTYDGSHDHWTVVILPTHHENFKLQGGVGFASSTEFEGSHLLYTCLMLSDNITNRADFFSSEDPACEGQQRYTYHWGPLGYVANTQIAGTIPLYRCLTNKGGGYYDHFDTVHADCEGITQTVNEKVLGYVFY
ncbi:hypothetical protein [Lysobacter antibioticus]|uniref:hypothetical protein n=1 Tax=Lysobacter antibioticus TaxID=84531 RepID=UPI000A5F83F7|nr:hypothetical protein [Lysobacter antibioticus]